MIRLLMSLVLLSVTLPCLASDHLPIKSPSATLPPPPDAAVIRQGGDTIADAVLLTLPVVDQVGTTTGYTDDYDHDCPFYSGPAPDVVYTSFAGADTYVDIDLFGSSYGTKIWVYDIDLTVLAYSDDYYPDYTSLIEHMQVYEGEQYFLIMDGYGGDHGEYLLNIDLYTPCELEIPFNAEPEGEPPLAHEYVDTFNGGCGNGGTSNWQYWNSPAFHGRTGNFLLEGSRARDSDWLEIPINPEGMVMIEGDSNYM